MALRCFLFSSTFVYLSVSLIAGCRKDLTEEKVAPAVNSNIALDHPNTKMIITKRYRTQFKGLTLGTSTLEEANKSPGIVSGATKPGPNPLFEPDLWLGEATLHFEKHDKTLTSVQIYDVGFEDINRVTIGGPWSQLEKLAGKTVTDRYYIDERSGVVYWDDEGRGTVTKIVYVSSLRVRAE